MSNGVSTTLDVLIATALTGLTYNQRRLGDEARRYARRLSKAKAPQLPDDLHDDICQQAFVELFRIDPAALDERTGTVLFRRAVLAALRIVQAAHAPPGLRSRPTPRDPAGRVAAEDIGRIANAAAVVQAEGGHAGGGGLDRVADPRAQDDLRWVGDALDVAALLRRASADVAAALRMIHLDDEPVGATAEVIGLDRFTLNRRMAAFFKTVRAAA